MKFAYTLVCVPDVAASLAFFEKAFGFRRKFLHEAGDYGELDSGATTIGFVSHALAAHSFPGGYVAASDSQKPLGVVLAFTTPAVEPAHAKAIAAGAVELTPPAAKPWGQVVSHLRCPDGTTVELCTPME